ncbi:MAG TPA: hypothetical protein VGZ93_12860 [Candidatus Methylacidiphilales bacterium]|jgi:Zn-dependent protease|nr:hypothetical protein [Candidatus Methylacidiphilales bacterium]
MAAESKKPESTPFLSPDRLWVEQLGMGTALLAGILIFMALFHAPILSAGAKVLGPNDLGAYGWMSALGVFLQVVVHELGSIVAAWCLKLPVRLRFFGFGANASAILARQPRRAWIDAVMGFAGPLTGTAASVGLALTYNLTGNPYFLGIACVGYFYNLVTLIPILDFEGGWIASAIAPQAWLFGSVAMALELTNAFNLVLLGVFSFALPRLILLIRARAPRTDVECTGRQRVTVAVVYFVLVVGLAWFASTTFDHLPALVREYEAD